MESSISPKGRKLYTYWKTQAFLWNPDPLWIIHREKNPVNDRNTGTWTVRESFRQCTELNLPVKQLPMIRAELFLTYHLFLANRKHTHRKNCEFSGCDKRKVWLLVTNKTPSSSQTSPHYKGVYLMLTATPTEAESIASKWSDRNCFL